MPGHMRHVQDSVAEFPRNGDPYPYRNDGPKNREDRLKGIPDAPPQPGSGEPQVKDEKTLAHQNNPYQKTDTTVRNLPHYESGGKLPKGEQERKEKYERENPNKNYEGSKMGDGSLKSQLLDVSNMEII